MHDIEARRYLQGLILVLSVYPTITFLTSVLVGALSGTPQEGLLVGLRLVLTSLVGLIPVFGPFLYLNLTLLSEPSIDMWFIPKVFGLLAAISYTVITTRMLIDYVKLRRSV